MTLRGRPWPYWDRFADRWMALAFTCRYGHQDIYRLLGRDAIAAPLTDLELACFNYALQEHWNREVDPKAITGQPSND